MYNRDMKTFGVYSIVFHTDHGDMIYIGSTGRSFSERFQKHRWRLNRGVHHSPIMQRYWNKYGNTAEFLVLETCDDPGKVSEREQYYINLTPKERLLNSGPAIPNPMAGRHQSPEAKRKLSQFFKGRKVSEETKEKLRRQKLGKPGIPHTEEARAKMSKSQTGRHHSLETREKMSHAQKGRIITPEAREKLRQVNLGKKHTSEAKEKMSASRKGLTHSAETRARMSEIQKILKQDPAGHDKRAEAAKRGWIKRKQAEAI